MYYLSIADVRVSCVFGKRYRFCMHDDLRSFSTLHFYDEGSAIRFLQRLRTSEQFWQRLSSQLPVDSVSNNDALRRIANLLVRGRLRLVEDSDESQALLKPFAHRNGMRFSFISAKTPVFDDNHTIKKFSHQSEVLSFLQELHLNPEHIAALQTVTQDHNKRLGPRQSEQALDDIANDIVDGKLTVVKINSKIIREKKLTVEDVNQAKVVPLGPHVEEGSELRKFNFKLKLIDHVGEAINGVEVAFVANGEHHDYSSSSGLVSAEGIPSKFAIANIANIDQLIDKLIPHWQPFKPVELPDERDMTIKAFDKADAAISLVGDTPHTLAILPPLGKIHVVLTDKTLSHVHAQTAYRIEGPVNFSGETDEHGMLLHDDVPPGDYTLQLSLAFFEGKDFAQTDDYSIPLTVLDKTAQEPQRRAVGVVPQTKRATIKGIVYDTNKSFILPNAIAALKQIREFYIAHANYELLIIGHTDTSGEPEINNALSEQRAKNAKAFLDDDVDTWLTMYEQRIATKQRWGAREDRLMIRSLPDFQASTTPDLVRWFQRTRDLTVDGIAGPKTREKLIAEYMALDGEDFKESFGASPSITILGLGENFPLDASGEKLDDAPEDGQQDLRDRRVEFFFFDREFGILPPVSDAQGQEYPEWFAQADLAQEDIIEGNRAKATHIDVSSTLFRTGSAVMLPEGEAPTTEQGQAVSSVGVLAGVLRYNAETNRLQKMLVAGHTDSVGSDRNNQKLSEQRAELVHAVLMGNRATFVDIAKQTGKVSDWKQILRWASEALGTVTPLKQLTLEDIKNGSDENKPGPSGFEKCNPASIDDNAQSGKSALKAFQQAFNNNKKVLGSDAPDLVVDGVMGKLSWGAMFDCYQYNLAQELGADSSGVQSLRDKCRFLETEKPFIGFGEAHPADGNNKDNTESQANRRVEILFFDLGEEPDLAILAESPELCEVYLPDQYDRIKLPVMVSAKPWFAFWDNAECSTTTPGKINLLALGLPEGQSISLDIENSFSQQSFSVDAQSQKNNCTADITGWELGLINVEAMKFANDQEFPLVSFAFTVNAAGRRVHSANTITFVEKDRVDLSLQVNEKESIIAQSYPYTIVTLLGSRKGVTGKGLNSGEEANVILLNNIPPGGYCVLIDGAFGEEGFGGRQTR